MKNPNQAQVLAAEIQKALGIYEEVRDWTDPERIQRRILERLQEMNEEEKEQFAKKSMKIYKNYSPEILEKLEQKFPWHLRYYQLILILIVLSSATAGFLIGYFLEPEQEINY